MIKTENGNMNQQNSDEPEQFRKLFIGGLDYRTTDDSLKEFYEQWGEIVDVVVMKDPKTRRSRGFGFVTYAQQSMVDEAMSHRPHKVDGREVEAKRAVPRESKPENGVTSKKLFIGGIKDEHDEDALTNYFSEYGKVVSATVAVDKNTDKKRGFAFVEFDDYDPADKVILKGGEHWICGKKVDVKKAISKEEKAALEEKRARGAARGGGGWGGGGRGMGAGGGGYGGQGDWGSGGGGYSGGPWASGGGQGGWGGSQNGGGGWGGGGGYGTGGGWGGGGDGGFGGGYQQGYAGGPQRGGSYGSRPGPYGGASSGGAAGGYGGYGTGAGGGASAGGGYGTGRGY